MPPTHSRSVGRATTLQIDTRKIRDPLKRDLERMRKEKEALGMEVPDFGPCPGKTMFPVSMYADAEATPAGHFSEPDGALKAPMSNYVETAAKKAHSRVRGRSPAQEPRRNG